MSNRGIVGRRTAILLVVALALALGLGLVRNAGAAMTGTTPEGFTYSIVGDVAIIAGDRIH